MNRTRLVEAARQTRPFSGAVGTLLTVLLGTTALIVVGSALGRGVGPDTMPSDLIAVPPASNRGPGAPERLIEALSGALRSFTGAPVGEPQLAVQAVSSEGSDAAPDVTPPVDDPDGEMFALVEPVADDWPPEPSTEFATAAATWVLLAASPDRLFVAGSEGESSNTDLGEAAFASMPAAAESEPSPPRPQPAQMQPAPLPPGLAGPTSAPAAPTRRPRATAVPPTSTQRPKATATPTIAAPSPTRTRTPTAIRTATRTPTTVPSPKPQPDYETSGSRDRSRDD